MITRNDISDPLRGIGSTFLSEPLGTTASEAPWSLMTNVKYAWSGRQAMRLLAEELWSHGRRELILPAFLCESMIVPFESRPWRIGYYAVDKRARPLTHSYSDSLGNPELTVALVGEYFGRAITAEWHQLIAQDREIGVRFIEDRTHNLFDSRPSPADYVVASLRKLLPLGDGGLVAGSPIDYWPSFVLSPVDLYWQAMDLKAQSGDPAQLAEANRCFQIAERGFELDLCPSEASARTIESVSGLNYESMIASRGENGRILADLLANFEVVNYDWSIAPSHLVLRVDLPEAFQSELAKAGVFCPIHWPRPSHVPREFGWNADLISIPVDHRYGYREMQYIAQSMTELGKRIG